jgi:hypothetical protein
VPNPGSDKPLRKVTLNLYEDDVILSEKKFGRGWSTELRELWSAHLRNLRGGVRKLTVEDLINE